MARIDELVRLESLPLAQLRDEWQRQFNAPAPMGVGHHLLASGIACAVQEKRLGGLTGKQIRMLGRFADPDDQGEGPSAITATPRAGTRLVREWRGVTHHVEVKEQGFIYRDTHYPSLSPIAEQITGARWSGPRFFGLVRRRANAGKTQNVSISLIPDDNSLVALKSAERLATGTASNDRGSIGIELQQASVSVRSHA